MKFLVISLLSVSLLFATVYEGTTDEDLGIAIDAGSETIDSEMLGIAEGADPNAPPEPLDHTTLMNINDPTSAFEYSSPIERAISREDEDPTEWPEQDWFDDIEVYPGEVGTGQDFDTDEDTGDMYAIFDTAHSTLDSLVVYRSTDGGLTWSFFVHATNTDGRISNPKIRVVKDGGGITKIMVMGIWHETSGNIIWTRPYNTNGTGGSWSQADNDASFADMDADIGTGGYVYITYVPNGTTNARVTRNLLDGNDWVDDSNVMNDVGPVPYPAIAAGADGNVSVTFITDYYSSTPQVRIKRSVNYGSSWIVSEPVSNTDVIGLEDTDIASSHGSTQTIWIFATKLYASVADNLCYYYSTDSGISWTYGGFIGGGSTTIDQNNSNIRSRKVYGDVTVAYNQDPGNDVMFIWTTTGNPTNFTTPAKINDFYATGIWPPSAGWTGSGYSAIMYADYTNNYRLMFDWWGNTGIEGSSPGLDMDMIQNFPNPFSATTNISFSLAQSSPVTISIYNLAGQLVSTLADNQSFNEGSHSVQWDGQNLSPGVYFCRLDADGISQTHRMLMVR